MGLHVMKLCVGVASVAALEGRIARRGGRTASHLTRLLPVRAAEIEGEAGGSLYWVMSGQIACRQRILRIEAVTGGRGKRCRFVLDPRVVPVRPKPCRPFQGWRYLAGDDAPPDVDAGAAALPERLRRDLAALGLI